MPVRREHILEVSVAPTECIKALRILGQEAGWSLERHEGSRLVDRFAIIMPIAQSARSIGIKYTSGPLAGMEMHSWAETRGTTGAVVKTAWTTPGGVDEPVFRDLLHNWVAILPRCPWRWSFGERSKVGFLLPVWHRSKKEFTKLGFNTKRKTWPARDLPEWPPAEIVE